jgi:hypothetical protein
MSGIRRTRWCRQVHPGAPGGPGAHRTCWSLATGALSYCGCGLSGALVVARCRQAHCALAARQARHWDSGAKTVRVALRVGAAEGQGQGSGGVVGGAPEGRARPPLGYLVSGVKGHARAAALPAGRATGCSLQCHP